MAGLPRLLTDLSVTVIVSVVGGAHQRLPLFVWRAVAAFGTCNGMCSGPPDIKVFEVYEPKT